MTIRCLVGLHRPLLTSIMRRPTGFAALCEDCALPIERSEAGRWTAAAPLVERQDRAA